jgi:hypothetical protein
MNKKKEIQIKELSLKSFFRPCTNFSIIEKEWERPFTNGVPQISSTMIFRNPLNSLWNQAQTNYLQIWWSCEKMLFKILVLYATSWIDKLIAPTYIYLSSFGCLWEKKGILWEHETLWYLSQ